jgi:hypothetical protein
MMKKKLMYAAVVFLMAGIQVAQAAVVSWNYSSSSPNPAYSSAYVNQAANISGVAPAAYWNDALLDGRTIDLLDNTGAATTIDITSLNSPGWGGWRIRTSHPGTDTDGSHNREIVNGYLNGTTGAGGSGITLSGIGYSSYNVIVYFSSDVAGRSGSITNGTTTFYFNTLGPASINNASGNAVLAQTSNTTVGDYSVAANYAVFSGLTGNTQTFTVNVDLGGGLAAFQIVDTSKVQYNSPANGANLIPVLRTAVENNLVFNVIDSNITKVDVQFGTENDPNLTSKSAYKIVNGKSVTPGQYTITLESELASDLQYNTTYHWKVIGYEPNGIGFTPVPGPAWSFTTVPTSPVFTVNPGTSSAFPGTGASVALSATVSSLTPLTSAVQWFKVGTPDVEIMAGGNVTIVQNTVGSLTTSTLTINNVTAAADGQYYAKAANSGGSGLSSNGWIVIKKLLAQYLFENNLNDNSGNGMNGTNQAPSGTAMDPNYLASVNSGMGQALIFHGTGNSDPANATGNYVDLPDGFSNFSQGLTITAWVYPTAANNWARIVQFGNGTDGASNSFYFTRVGTESTLRFENDNTNPASATSITTGNDGITLNEWQFLAVTLNTSTSGNAVIYRNGVPAATGTVTLPNAITRTNCFIGRSEWYGDSLFKGQMDDVRVYNYGLSMSDIGQVFYAVTGIPACQVRPTYDYDGNCKVDLADFATFAAQWLNCGLYPSTACN